MNESFELEGIEIRIQQKALAEFVEQSSNVTVDYSINPKIFFSDDGSVYFFDESIEEPIALSNVENFYKRIRLEEGQLRFYDKDLATYFSLSFFVDSQTEFVDKGNALQEGVTKRIVRDTAFDSKEQYLSALNIETAVKEFTGFTTSVPTSAGPDYLDILEDFKRSLFVDVVTATGETVFDFLINNFTYGLSKFTGTFEQNSAIFNLDSGEFINKATGINDRFFTVGAAAGENATPLLGQLFSTLVNESADIFQTFDGMGNLLHKFFNRKTIGTLGNGYDLTRNLHVPGDVVNTTFTIDASANGYGCERQDVTPVSLGSFYKGYLAFKYKSGLITSETSTGLYNTPLGSSECGGASVSVVETSLGDLSFTDTDIISVTNENEVFAWFRMPSSGSDGAGSVDFQYVFTPLANSLVSNFLLDATSMADFTQEEEIESVVTQSWIDGASGAPYRKMIGVFDSGTITFKIESGYVRPDEDFDTVYNETQTFSEDMSSALFDYGYVNSTLGRIQFGIDNTFDIIGNQLVEVWYEDFDNTDNDGTLVISYDYSASQEVIDSERVHANETLVYDGFITNPNYKHLLDYCLDHCSRLVSFSLSSLWYNSLFEELAARGYIDKLQPNKIIDELIQNGEEPVQVVLMSKLIESTNTRFRTQIYYQLINEGQTDDPAKPPEDLDDVVNELPFKTVVTSFLDTNFFQDKVFYENDEFTDLNLTNPVKEDEDFASGIVDFRNYLVYSAGSGISQENLIFRDLTEMNDVWLDLPETHAVVPKSPNNYAISTMVNFTADYRPGVPCILEFRLWDSTSQTELDRVAFDFNRMPHTDQIGDILFENREPLDVQLSYFGPIPSINCTEQQFKQACELNGRNVNEHVVLSSTSFTDDAVNFDTFQIIADRVTDFIKKGGGKVGEDDELIEIAAPRVLRVQWRMQFADEVGLKPQLVHDLPQFKFDAYAPENENLFTLNVYSFGEVYGRGITAQGIATFDGTKKSVLVDDDSIAIMPDTSYSVSLSPSKNINVWIESKSLSGFEIVSEKEFKGEVSWVAIRQRNGEEQARKQDDPKTIPNCIIDREYRFSAYTDLEILEKEGYYNSDGTLPDTEVVDADTQTTETDELPVTFIDPNGVRCSQECFDDCPEDYICSPDCYTASLTESGCGCCQCVEDNDCPPGYTCNEVNECVPI